MGKETSPGANELLRGKNLKRAVRVHMQDRARRRKEEGSAHLALTLGLLNNLDIIDPGWDIPQNKIAVTNSIGSFCASFHYAHILTGSAESRDNFIELFNEPVSHPDRWRYIIRDTMADPKMKADFQANAWRAPTTVYAERGIALEYILSRKFGNRPITVVDLGAGLHTAVPLINSSRYNRYNFPDKDKIQNLLGDVNVTLGLGVDIQPRDEQWAQSSIWPIEGGVWQLIRFTSLMTEIYNKRDDNKFPFLQRSVTDPDTLYYIQQLLYRKSGKRRADAVDSSFLRQFLGNDPGVQQRFKDLVKDLLEEGGIWIDSGAENIESYHGTQGSEVKVYEKQGNDLVHIGTPFILRDQIDIESVDLSYFGVSR
jgi:hypothetical protein